MRMSIAVMTQVWKSSQHQEGALLVLLAIADFADDDGYAYPSVIKLATKARLSERQTQYVLAKLEESGELTRQKNAGPHGVNLYRVLVGGAIIAPVQFATSQVGQGGAVYDIKGVQSIAPKSSYKNRHKDNKYNRHISPKKVLSNKDVTPRAGKDWDDYVQAQAHRLA